MTAVRVSENNTRSRAWNNFHYTIPSSCLASTTQITHKQKGFGVRGLGVRSPNGMQLHLQQHNIISNSIQENPDVLQLPFSNFVATSTMNHQLLHNACLPLPPSVHKLRHPRPLEVLVPQVKKFCSKEMASHFHLHLFCYNDAFHCLENIISYIKIFYTKVLTRENIYISA